MSVVSWGVAVAPFGRLKWRRLPASAAEFAAEAESLRSFSSRSLCLLLLTAPIPFYKTTSTCFESRTCLLRQPHNG